MGMGAIKMYYIIIIIITKLYGTLFHETERPYREKTLVNLSKLIQIIMAKMKMPPRGAI